MGFNRLWSISASLILPIILMGLLAVALVMVTANIYRKHIMDDQKVAISELVKLEAKELLDENLAVTNDLALSLNAAHFKKSIIAKDTAAIQNYLDSNFFRYFVTAGIVKLEKLYAYDRDFNLITGSSAGSSQISSEEIICPELRARASTRTGAARLASINELCTHKQRPYLSVIVPVGGLRPIGYIQAATDPSHFLSRIETKLGSPIQIKLQNNVAVFQSERWPDTETMMKDYMVSSTIIKNAAGKAILTVKTSRDMGPHFEKVRKTRNYVLFVAGIFTFVMGGIALIYMRISTITPIQRLMHHTREVRKQNIELDSKVEVKGAQEIRALASSFNEMTHRLSNLYQDLSSSNKSLADEITERKAVEKELQQAHDALEEKVVELNNQTLSLQEVNKQLVDEIQQRILAEKQLIKAREGEESAESANKEKTLFLSHMSHELRTPLNGILGYAQLMMIKADKTGQKHSEWAHRIYESGCYLLSLVDEILDLSTIEAGKIQLQMEAVELLPLVEECIQITNPSAQERGIETTNRLKQNCNKLFVRADRTRLKQVLLNLLSNGVKYNSEGGSLTLECSRPFAERLRISITDTGAGIDKTAQQQLFKPFNRLDANKKCIPGAGVGLAVTRKLTELMDGNIGVESEPGQGSTFWVEFNCEELNETADSNQPAPSLRDNLNLRSNATVLYIEDNPDNLLLVKDIFEHHMPGIQLITVDNTSQGIELALSEHPDLILMDINMPEIDGHEALAILQKKEQTREIPVIAVSAKAAVTDINHAMNAGFSEYITKPITDIDDFRKKLSRFLEPT